MLKNEPDKTFYAPEQVKEKEIFKESDIYSFGLCMLKLIVDNFEGFDFYAHYKDYQDLEKFFEYVTANYEPEGDENELFLLAKKMLKENPSERIDLASVEKELKDLLSSQYDEPTFAIKISDRALETYTKNNGIDQYEAIRHLEGKIKGYESFWEFSEGKNGRKKIKIAVSNLIFLCSDNVKFGCLSCFDIPENQEAEISDITANGLEQNASFGLFKNNQKPSGAYDNASYIIDELRERYRIKQLQNERLEIDKKSIKTEEELLEAEYKAIQEKKNTKFAIIKDINKGKDTITFEFVKADGKEDESQSNTELKNDDKHFFKKLIEYTQQINKEREKDFKQGQNVVVETEQDRDFSLNAKVERTDPAQNTLVLKLEKYGANKKIDERLRYKISYDYEVEEIVWNKRDRALKDLTRANTAIPNLLRKISNPKELRDNELVEIGSFFDEKLDNNQQEAVRKSLSLYESSEILLIQGPPGTGKTTTITEIVRQILKTRKYEKILVASQSNQAVDNVLEKNCETQDKILRIGNDDKNMSKIAKKYRAENVINKLIKENLVRIKANPITHSNEEIQAKLKSLQEGFSKSLQNITSKMTAAEGSKEYELGELFAKHIRLIFGTLIGISSWKDFREMVFDTVIVDEAGRATLSELLVPCIKAHKIVLVGDHKQLAPVIDDDVLEKLGDKEEARTSFFQRFFERLKDANKDNLKHTLTHNYRSERRICELYNNAFYDGALIVKDETNKDRQHSLSPRSSVMWIDTGDFDGREDKQKGTGKINEYNAGIVEKVLKGLHKELKEKGLQYDLGVITPYKDQANLLKDKIKNKDFEGLDFLVGTVDSFQGSDRDIIIYDCVRSSKNKQKAKIDFIADEKRLNVSLSRAKRLLVIVGDMDFLYKANANNNNPFVKIIEHINEHKKDYLIIRSTDGKEKN